MGFKVGIALREERSLKVFEITGLRKYMNVDGMNDRRRDNCMVRSFVTYSSLYVIRH
jgi:hypothetical protein